MKKTLVTICVIFCTCLWASAQDYQEVVYLKNGTVIRGVVIEQIPNVSLKIQTTDGNIFAFEIADVDRITKEETSNQRRRLSGQARTNSFTENSFTRNKTGYRGFFELGGVIGTGDWGDGAFSVSTTHGYQFNPYFFLGAGVGADYHFDWETVFIPIFADARAYLLDGRISPFIGLKAGYSVYDGTGFYLNPNVGVSYALSSKFGLNLSLGYSLQKADVYVYFAGQTYSSKETIGGVSIKVGFEF